MSNDNLAADVVRGFGPNWHIAEIAVLYPNDILQVTLNIAGQRAEGILANGQWVLHEGDWVGCIGPHAKTRQYLIIAYFGTAAPGDWFEGDAGEVDYTQGNGPIAGTRLPLGGWDSLWKLIAGSTTDETIGAYQLTPRQAPNDATYGDLLKVILGRSDEVLAGYGTAIVPGDPAIGARIRLMRHLPPVFDPPGWCSLGETSADGLVTFKAGAHVGYRPAPGMAYQVGGGVCGNANPSDLTTMSFGNNVVFGQEAGFDIHLKLVAGAKPGELFYFMYQPFTGDRQFVIRYLGGTSIAVGWTYAILTGTPAYPSAGNWTTFVLPPTVNDGKEDRNRKGQVKAAHFAAYYDFTVSYRGNADGTATVSCDYNNQSYNLTSWIWGGFPGQDWIAYAGNFEGYLLGSLGINDKTFYYGISQPPAFAPGLPGEVAWHAHAYIEDPVDPGDPTGPTWSVDPGDLLEDGLYLCLIKGKWVRIAGTSTKINSDEDWQGANSEGSSTPIYPDLSQLGGLSADVLTQYANVARIKQFLIDAGVTADDLSDPNHRLLNATDLLTVTRGLIVPEWDLSDQIDGIKRVFDLPNTTDQSRVEIRLNNIPLRIGRDCRFLSNTSIQIDVRAPVATTPKDRLTARYVPVT